MYIDLHMHSTFSDGVFTPTEVVGMAADKGLVAISLTDHDCLDGLGEARVAGEQKGVKVFAG